MTDYIIGAAWILIAIIGVVTIFGRDIKSMFANSSAATTTVERGTEQDTPRRALTPVTQDNREQER